MNINQKAALLFSNNIISRQKRYAVSSGFIKESKIVQLLSSLLLLSIFLIPNAFSQEQRFKAGINLGLTGSQINGDDSANFNKLGITAGLRALTILTPKSDLVIELLYSQRGSRTDFGKNSALPERFVNLKYIEIPVIYTLKDWYQEDDDYYKMHFQGGFSYGRLFESSFENSPLEAAAPFYRDNDFSWLVGVIFHTNAHFGFYARYTRSMNLLYKNDRMGPNVNSLLSFFLSFGGTYVF